MDTQPMPFDGHDVQRVAKHLDNRHPLVRRLFGLKSHGVAHLLRSLWYANEKVEGALRAMTGAFRLAQNEVDDLKWKLRNSITFLLDEALARADTKKSFVILLSPRQFQRLDYEYDCPDKFRASTKERWAYTYKGHRIFTMAGIQGPVLIDPKAFDNLNAYRADLTIREM